MKNIGGEIPTNGGKKSIDSTAPYQVRVKIKGSSDFLFHRWDPDAIEAKGKAAKGSTEKKTDNIESYVYRDDDGFISIPGEYLRMAIIFAAKFKQDPRSPRKSAMDIFKAGVIVLTKYASTGKQNWDYLDKRRVVVQRSGINRTRPALSIGWECEFDIQILLPEYIDESMLNEVISMAGRLIGIGDFRPTYGRFQITKFENI